MPPVSCIHQWPLWLRYFLGIAALHGLHSATALRFLGLSPMPVENRDHTECFWEFVIGSSFIRRHGPCAFLLIFRHSPQLLAEATTSTSHSIEKVSNSIEALLQPLHFAEVQSKLIPI